MINLISPDHRKNIQAAKSNTMLMSYIQILLLALLVIAATITGSYYFLALQRDSAAEIASVEQASVKDLEPYQKKAENLATSMTAIAGVFDNDVSFLQLLQELGRNMPSGAALNGFTVSTETTDSPLVATAYINTEAQGVVLLENFRKSAVVTEVTLRTVQKLEEPVGAYRYSATYEVVLNKEAI